MIAPSRRTALRIPAAAVDGYRRAAARRSAPSPNPQPPKLRRNLPRADRCRPATLPMPKRAALPRAIWPMRSTFRSAMRSISGPRPRCSRRPAMTALVYGPGDIAQAHTADEWVALEQLHRLCAESMHPDHRAGSGMNARSPPAARARPSCACCRAWPARRRSTSTSSASRSSTPSASPWSRSAARCCATISMH